MGGFFLVGGAVDIEKHCMGVDNCVHPPYKSLQTEVPLSPWVVKNQRITGNCKIPAAK